MSWNNKEEIMIKFVVLKYIVLQNRNLSLKYCDFIVITVEWSQYTYGHVQADGVMNWIKRLKLLKSQTGNDVIMLLES
jgi:hypothetical protein